MDLLSIKGHADNVELLFTKDVSFEEAKDALLHMPEKSFYTNSDTRVSYSGVNFTYDEEMQFEKCIKTFFGKKALLIKKHRLTLGQIKYSLEDGENICKIVNKSLRSGEEINFNGDVIIYGDVNPGAFVSADGNITVIGALRGCAKVKKYGRVYATYMSPSQIRIGRLCSYNKKTENVGPAVAMAKNGEIILQCL